MGRVNIYIDGTKIKSPDQNSFKESMYLVTDMSRNAAGTMNGQILSVKHKLFFTYEAIMGYELNIIYNILKSTPLFHRVWYTLDGVAVTRYMYVGEMPKTLHRTGQGSGPQSTWVYKDVNFNLIER